MNVNTPVTPHPKGVAMKLNSSGYIFNFFLGRISALMCAIFILLVGALMMTSWMDSILRIDVNSPYYSGARLAGNAIGLLLLLAIIIYCGIAFGRFILRAAPPQLAGRVRLGLILITIPLAFICTITSGGLLLYINRSNNLLEASAFPYLATIYVVPLLTWWAGVVIPLYERRLNPCAFLDRPFVLFLRRFSNFSDRMVINLILRQIPLGKPLVLLTPTRSRAGDWNPFLVGFAGMKLLHPFRSVPFIIGSPDGEWEQAAQFLMHHAQIIVFDISEGSDAIEKEFAMISQAAYLPKTVFLKEDAAEANSELKHDIKLGSAQIIYYRKSWIRGLPRMLLGLVALMFSQVATPVFVVAGLLVVLTDRILGLPPSRTLILLFGLPPLAWLYYSFFVRPSVDSAAKTSLRKILLADRKSNVS